MVGDSTITAPPLDAGVHGDPRPEVALELVPLFVASWTFNFWAVVHTDRANFRKVAESSQS